MGLQWLLWCALFEDTDVTWLRMTGNIPFDLAEEPTWKATVNKIYLTMITLDCQLD